MIKRLVVPLRQDVRHRIRALALGKAVLIPQGLHDVLAALVLPAGVLVTVQAEHKGKVRRAELKRLRFSRDIFQHKAL